MFIEIQKQEEVSVQFPGVEVFGIRLSVNQGAVKFDAAPIWNELAAYWSGKSKIEVSEHEMISAYNVFFTQLGINVKKKPPSIQNIIQRFLIGDTNKPFPKINPIVDAVNLAAVSRLIPLGVFDAACVEGTLKLGFSKGGEFFLGIGAGSPVTLERGKLVLTDDVKVLSEFSIRDSQAQMITDKTQDIWLLGCMVPGVKAQAVKEAMGYALTLIQ